MWYAGEWPGPWPLLLLALPWLLRPIVFGFSLRPTVFDAALLLFVASAGVGVWAAYDPGPAWAKFWLIVGAAGLCYALAHQPDEGHLYISLAFFAVFGVALALYFFATNDWDAMPKVAVLVTMGKEISARLPALAGHQMHPNVVGGMLAAVLPLIVALIGLSGTGRRRWLAALWGAAGLVAGAAWLLSMSRGAWLALLGVGGLWGVWRTIGGWLRRRNLPAERAWRLRLAAMGGLFLMGLVLLVVVAALVLNGHLPGAGTLTSRLVLFRRSLLLARDYFFTGLGLGMFGMQYSTYTLLIHCFHIVHSHNMLLNLWIEQGLLGLAAYLLLAIACCSWCLRLVRRAGATGGGVAEAALCSLGVILAHGLVDDPLYGSRGVLLLFVPFGIAWAAWRMAYSPAKDQHPQEGVEWYSLPDILLQRGLRPRQNGRSQTAREPGYRVVKKWYRWAGGAVFLILMMALAIFWRPLLGTWYANLGAVEQSRLELAVYVERGRAAGVTLDDLDQIRRQEGLERAAGWLERAVQVDAANATARQRLAALALSRGQYEAALAHMQAAWEAGHRDEVTRLLLGDALVANGRVEQAAEVVGGLEWGESRLGHQAWYRYWHNQDYRRAADAWHTLTLLDPDDTGAAYWQAEAEARLQR